jgi:hypothetical protein
MKKQMAEITICIDEKQAPDNTQQNNQYLFG